MAHSVSESFIQLLHKETKMLICAITERVMNCRWGKRGGEQFTTGGVNCGGGKLLWRWEIVTELTYVLPSNYKLAPYYFLRTYVQTLKSAPGEKGSLKSCSSAKFLRRFTREEVKHWMRDFHWVVTHLLTSSLFSSTENLIRINSVNSYKKLYIYN